MSSTTASGVLAGGAWFGELASALQGTWQAVCEHRPRQQQPKLGGGGGLAENNNKKAAVGDGNRTTATKKEAEDVVACGGAISDATLCLLLDRFAPS